MAAGVLIAAVAAVLSVYRIDGASLKPRSLQYASATTQVVLNVPKVTISVGSPKCTTGPVVAHVGTTYTNRSLVIEQDGVTIASGTVDASGNLRTAARSAGHHTFAALFAGDSRYTSGEADVTVC